MKTSIQVFWDVTVSMGKQKLMSLTITVQECLIQKMKAPQFFGTGNNSHSDTASLPR